MKTGPYLAITGYMNPFEVQACGNAFLRAIHEYGHPKGPLDLKFMIGVLVSYKSLRGEVPSNPQRYPMAENVYDIIAEKCDYLLYAIHYNTRDKDTIDEQVDEIMKLSPNIDAVQLNIAWVDHVKLQRIARKYPELRIIIQVGAGALSEVEEPEDIYLGDALKAYDGVAHDFLVDPSGGTGKSLDIWKAFACIADSEMPASMRPGVAGGRDATNVHEIRGLRRRLKREVNLDSERRVRDESDQLNLPAAYAYINAGVKEFMTPWTLR